MSVKKQLFELAKRRKYLTLFGSWKGVVYRLLKPTGHRITEAALGPW